MLVVQHMPGTFTSQFSRQLAEVCPQLKWKEAEAGESQPGSDVYLSWLASMRVSERGASCSTTVPHLRLSPGADVTLETAAAFAGPMCVGVILTGMGNDGRSAFRG